MKVSKSRHNPTDITTIKGYPDSLKLFRMPASKYWYVRMYIKGRASSGVKKSTRCEKLSDAKDFAINWYEERLLEKRRFTNIGAESFATYAKKFQDRQKRQINRGELDADMFYQDKLKLDNDILPSFGSIHIAKIDYNSVDILIDELRTERNLSVSSLKKFVVCIRKVLKEAEKEGIISSVPRLPTIKTGNVNPRPWFSPEEYKRLLDACRDLRDNPPTNLDKFDKSIAEKYRASLYKFDWGEMYDFIVFMIHTFLRPSEWKLLQNKHIQFHYDAEGHEQLLISVPNPKTMKSKGLTVSTSTEIAADIYRNRILKRQDGKNDYLFFNDIRDREDYATTRISRMFRVVCQHAELDTDRFGQKHTTYSLRHSALCFQILKTKGEGLFALAKNARTSTEMLEKFYLSHLSAQMPEFTEQLLTVQSLGSLQNGQNVGNSN